MAHLDRWYPPTWKGRPEGMPWPDYQVWIKYLESPAALFDEYAFNVELHGGLWTTPHDDPQDNALWNRLTSKRVDAIGRKAGMLTLIELRDRLTWQTIGQLLGYQRMFALDYPEYQTTAPLIVAGTADRDALATAHAQGLSTYLVFQDND